MSEPMRTSCAASDGNGGDLAHVLLASVADPVDQRLAVIHRAMIDQANDAIALIDAETGRFVEFNRAAHASLGYTREEFAKLRVADVDAAQTPEEVDATTSVLKAEGRTLFESRHRHKDGHLIDVRVSAHLLVLDGHPHLVSMWSDITERKRLEERLCESEERFRHLFEDTAQAITLVENGRFVAVNRASLRMLGYASPEDFIGRTPDQISPPYQPDGQLSTVKAAALTEKAFADGSISFEWEHLRADGTPFLAEVLLTAMIHDGKRLLHVVWRDITAQRKIERELDAYRRDLEAQVAIRAAEQQAIFETATSGLALIRNRVLVLCNRRLHEIFGWLPGTLVGQPTSVWYPDEAANIAGGEAVYARIWQGEAHTREQQLMRKDGSLFWARLTGNAVDVNDRDKGTVWVIEDISDEHRIIESMRKARELAEEAARMKSDFVANMSHEIRTPMNAIIGLTHLVLKTELAPKQRDYLKKIQGSSQHLLGIINDILDFSKIEAGKLSIEHIEFELEKVLDSVAGLLIEKTASKGLELIIDVAPDVPLHLVGDPLRIGQVLINYANNAVKFTERGEIAIHVAVSHRAGDDVVLRFEVSDSGIGIAADQLGRLFKSFEQADTSTTRKYGGTGLGLAISKRLAVLMNGEVGVDSEPGSGSTFWFTARLGRGREAPAHLLPAPDLRGRHVLVVDDNDQARFTLAEMLRSMSFEVGAVASGREALAELRRVEFAGAPYEIVFLDWQMPELDGIATAKAIAGLGLANAPHIVMVTAHGRDELMTAASAAGIEQVLLKPLMPSLLFDTLMQLLGGAPMKSGAADESSLVAETLSGLAGARILLAEDNELNQEVAVDLLTAAGFSVDLAGDGAVALQKIHEAEYDLVLMDIQMPVMDGLETARAIRALPNRGQLPIVALTANAMSGDRERCLAAGMNDHIAKPIDPDDLWRKLLRWIPPRQGSKVGAGGTASDAASVTIPDGLRRIPGLDIERGLRLVMGRENLYLKLLAKFVSGQQDFGSRLDESLAATDPRAAERLVHSLKGMAAQIGAIELQGAAEALESAIRQRQPDAALATLRETVERLLAFLLAATAAFVHESENAGTGEFDEARFTAVCQDLRQRLTMDDFGCGQILENHADLLRAGLGDHYPWIVEAVEGFNFAAALDWLDESLDERRASP